MQATFFDPKPYEPRTVNHFTPQRIVLAKGYDHHPRQHAFVQKICNLYPEAIVQNQADTPHNRVFVTEGDSLAQHTSGKQTLVFSKHHSSLHFSKETGNTCPNYWHFSLYGFCPYGCTYCYLAGTPGVRFSPTVKIFLNLDEVLAAIDREARRQARPTSFYHGKLQDGLALDPLTGYSRQLVPFFARHRYAHQVILTKSADVENLLDLDHNRKTILSLSVNLPSVASEFEPNTPPMASRIKAMRLAVQAGYPVRAVLMPLIPVDNYLDCYATFLRDLLEAVPLTRLTIGAICSYPAAAQLMNAKLGQGNRVASNFASQRNAEDGRTRYPFELRRTAYEHLVQTVRSIRPDLEIGLCLETHAMFAALGMQESLGCCNCVL